MESKPQGGEVSQIRGVMTCLEDIIITENYRLEQRRLVVLSKATYLSVILWSAQLQPRRANLYLNFCYYKRGG